MAEISCKWLSCLWSNQPIRLIDATRSIPLRMSSCAVFRIPYDSKNVVKITLRLCLCYDERASSMHWPRSAISSSPRECERIAAAIRLIQSNFIEWRTTATKITPFIFHITLAIFLCIALPQSLIRTRAKPETFSLLLRAFLTFGRMKSDTHTLAHARHTWRVGRRRDDARCLHINCIRWL